MNFLYPGFLFALLAIAIPIAIHLFNFRKFKRLYFSNVQFLKEAKEQNSSREQLKHLLVLFSRIFAVIFLVFAFARPFIPGSGNSTPNSGNVVGIYIDNSYSMETVNKEGSLLDEAKRKAKEIAGSYDLNDQFQLFTNDFEGRHQRLVTKEEFIDVLEEVKISPASRSLQQVINRMQSDFDAGKNQHCYLLSDFQRSFVGSKPLHAHEAFGYNFVKLNANSLPNISVDSVWSLSPVHQPGEPEHMVVKLHNHGAEDAAGVPIKLTVNNAQKALGNVAVAAGKTVTDTLVFSRLTAGWQKAVLSIKDFPLTFDDALNFSFEVKRDLNVLHITGNSSERFIRSLFSSDPYFKLVEMPESNIKYSAFSEYSIIILSGLKVPSSGLAQQLRDYVQNGGSVVVFPDLTAGSTIYTPFLSALSLPAVSQLNSGPPISSTLDANNEVFKDVFDQVPKNMDLPVVNRYFSYVNQSRHNQETILQLPLNNFLFARYSLGAGKLYLSASSLDIKDSNLPRHPLFVPLMYKVAFASVRQQRLFYKLGADNLLESQQIALLKNETIKLVSENIEVIPELRQAPGKTLLYIADQVKRPGFYTLKKADTTLAVMAFNDNRAESDMNYASEKELSRLFGSQKVAVFNSRKDAQSINIQAKNNGTELWKLCLILGVVFLAIEIALIRFFNTSEISIRTNNNI